MLLEQSSLELSSVEPLLAGIFLIFSLCWPLSTHSEHTWVSFILGRKGYPVTVPVCQDLPLFFLYYRTLEKYSVPGVFSVSLTVCSSLKPYAPAQITSELVMPDLLASFPFT